MHVKTHRQRAIRDEARANLWAKCDPKTIIDLMDDLAEVERERDEARAQCSWLSSRAAELADGGCYNSKCQDRHKCCGSAECCAELLTTRAAIATGGTVPDAPEQDDTRIAVREPVRWFAGMMEKKLREHDSARGPVGWRTDCDDGFLLSRIYEEWRELVSTTGRSGTNYITAIDECADVANFAMMIADIAVDFEGDGTLVAVDADGRAVREPKR